MIVRFAFVWICNESGYSIREFGVFSQRRDQDEFGEEVSRGYDVQGTEGIG